MIETNGWDSLMIVARHSASNGWEVRVGAGCVLSVSLIVFWLIEWLWQDDRPRNTT